MLGFAVEIAAQAGIKYPADRVSGYPYVLTCDFMVTTVAGLDFDELERLELEQLKDSMVNDELSLI